MSNIAIISITEKFKMEKKVNVSQTNLFEDFNSPAYKEFKAYDEANPQIWMFFKRYALKAIERGHKHLSAEYIFSICRWETSVGAGDDEFKLNNNAKAGYARKFMREFPQYNEFFRTRKSKLDKI